MNPFHGNYVLGKLLSNYIFRVNVILLLLNLSYAFLLTYYANGQVDLQHLILKVTYINLHRADLGHDMLICIIVCIIKASKLL